MSFCIRCFLVILVFLSIQPLCYAQNPEINRILEKLQSGREISEIEQEKLVKWGEEIEKQMEKTDPDYADGEPDGAAEPDEPAALSQPPEPAELTVKFKEPPLLTSRSYLALCRSIMQEYGSKLGVEKAGLDRLLDGSGKTTDGADLGVAFMMKGAGSASVYSIAWSALKNPEDVLAANNLGVALLQIAENMQALQVLLYADKLRPDVALVKTNLGWVYRELNSLDNAKSQFGKALSLTPEMTSPNLGLGLIAQKEGRLAEAGTYLRKALKDQYSSAGIAAYQKVQESQNRTRPENTSDKPLSNEKDTAGGFRLAELPVAESPAALTEQAPALRNHVEGLDRKMTQLMNEYNSVLKVVIEQQTKAKRDPDNAVVFNRDFSKEMMMIEDITLLLFGESSNYGRAVDNGTKLLSQAGGTMEKDMPLIQQMGEKFLKLQEKLNALMEEAVACGGNEACLEQVEKRMTPVRTEMEDLGFRMCKLQKQHMDILLAGKYKYYSMTRDALKEAARDYYAFTDPLIEKIYAPSFNELQNLHRELLVLSHEIPLARFALSMAEEADGYNDLDCVPPEPPESEKPVEEGESPKKKPGKCPLGDGIGGGIGPLSFELTCTYVKLSGGEGILWSVSRDFTRRETKIWGGIGAKGEYGYGNVSVEAAVGVELTIGAGDALKDVAFTSSVKAGLGELMEANLSGRFAAEAGPSFTADGGFTMPPVPSMPGLPPMPPIPGM